jgi:hypothetical protein
MYSLEDAHLKILKDNVYHLWLKTVQEYSNCDLTVDSDILVAIFGIAKHFQRSLGGTYLSRVWEGSWIAGLL